MPTPEDEIKAEAYIRSLNLTTDQGEIDAMVQELLEEL
jgi:hypothetical protein